MSDPETRPAVMSETGTDEVQRLRTLIRDLGACLSLPALWIGREPSSIAESLLDVLVSMLRLDIAYIRLNDANGGAALEATQPRIDVSPQEIGKLLHAWVAADNPAAAPVSVANPLGDGTLQIARSYLGLYEDGVVVVGSTRADFPTEIDSFLLGAAVTQALVSLRAARNVARIASVASENARLYQQSRETHEKLRESEERFQLIADSASVMVWISGTDKLCTWFNKFWLEFVGRSMDQELGNGWVDHVHPDDRDRCLKAYADGFDARQPFATEYRVRHRRGEYRWVLANGVPRFDPSGEFTGYIGSAIDITERKRAEEIRARLAAIIDSSDDAIVGKTLEGIITSWNRGAERIFGYTASEAVGQHIFFIIPEDRRAEENEVLARLRCGERVDHFETVRQAKDGRKIDISLTVSPIKDAEGRMIGASKVARDITDRKRAEEALQRLNAELEERVTQRTAQLVDAIAQREKLNEQLLQAQKMESVGTLASGIAHDFNNILNLILAYASVVKHNPDKPMKLLESVEVIEDTVKRGAALVQQLLATARKTAMKFELVDLNTVTEKLQILVNETFPKTIAVSLLLDKEVPPVTADLNQINQVLLNLCVNTRDAMPNGGELRLATGTITGAELRGRFQDAGEQEYAWISVADTGLGMDETTKERIFEPCFTTKELGRGTGLGLSVVYGIISNHGGFVTVASQPGQGTTVCIYLPISKDNAALTDLRQEVHREEAGEFLGAGETILFVDDEVRQLRVMKNFLESEGYRVLPAADGAEAVEMYLRHKDEIAVVVLDLGLPKLNGWEAFQKMKQEDPGLRAILATGYLSPEIESQMAQREVSGVIMKPYQIDDVLGKIRDAIDKRGSHIVSAKPSAGKQPVSPRRCLAKT